MKFILMFAALATLGSTSSDALSYPPIKRYIPAVSEHQMSGNLSYITSWIYTAFAYATVVASNSTSELTYLCANFNETSSRYIEAFPEQPWSDITRLPREVICDASRANPPAPLPIWYNTLWYMKSYMAGIFAIQGYAGKPSDKESENTQFYADMCWYLESRLLTGLWAPCRDTDEAGTDVESSWCAMSGYFGKGPFSQYDGGNVTAEVAAQADVLVSQVMARVYKVVVKEPAQTEYICENYEKYKEGITGLGLVSSVVEEWICAEQNRKVVPVVQARSELLDSMTNLFIWQLLHAGTYPGYHDYLCKTLRADGFASAGVNGRRVVDAACAAGKE